MGRTTLEPTGSAGRGMADPPASESGGRTTAGVWRFAWILLAAWTALLAGLWTWQYLRAVEHTAEVAETEAHAHFARDQAFRLWGSSHGGVYVPISERTPPSPYLSHIPDRDIVTPSGVRLTLVNPAYMVRQLQEGFAHLYGVRGHITSLRPLRSENGPDAWEAEALEALAAGAARYSGRAAINGEPYLRQMEPMIAKEGCLKCHGHQGYQAGDVRGGVSVSVPLAGLLDQQRGAVTVSSVSLGAIWLLGAAGIVATARHVCGRVREQARLSRLLEEQWRQLRSVFDAMNEPIYVSHPRGGEILYGNEAMRKWVGREDGGLEGELRFGSEDCAGPQQAAADAEVTYQWQDPRDGRWFRCSEKTIRWTDGQPARYHMAVEITASKRASELLQSHTAILESANQRLSDATLAAESASRAKNEFLADLGREIRPPMTAILGQADLLRGAPSLCDDAAALGAVQTIHRNAERLLGLVQDVLDIASIDGGELPLRRELFSLLELLDDAVAAMLARAGEKQVQLDLSFRTPLPVRAISDPARLRQALFGITECAIESCRGAALGVSVGMIEGSVLEVRLLDAPPSRTAEAAARGPQSHAAYEGASPGGDHRGLSWTITRHVVALLGGSLANAGGSDEDLSWTIRVPLELPDGTPRVDFPGATRGSQTRGAAVSVV